MTLTREQLDHTISFLEKQREDKARQCAALTCLKENQRKLMNQLFWETAEQREARIMTEFNRNPLESHEPTFRETIEEAVTHLIDSTLKLSLQDLQGIDANLQLLKQQQSPILIPQLGKR